jgi:predicted secreted protein|tara:strand:- start:596 stop:1018 length:423 start_codon:yes stop_codon:yes gene_type:complete
MATHIGRDGIVKVGGTAGQEDGTAVGEVRSFSIEETGDTVEYTSMGDSSRAFLPTLTSFSGSLDVYWDEDDAAQTTLAINTSVLIKFMPEGDSTAGTPDKFYQGTAIITGVSRSASFDGMVEASITVQGTGPLTLVAATP